MPPDIVSVDVTAVISDDELVNRVRYLEDDRQRAVDANVDPKPWEEEISYLRREMQIRRGRREAHDNYVKMLEIELAREEANLPVADLDNSRFLMIVGEN